MLGWYALSLLASALSGVIIGEVVRRTYRFMNQKQTEAQINYRNKREERIKNFTRLALQDPHFYEFLAWYHQVELYQHEDVEYPAVAFPIVAPQYQSDLNSVLAPWPAGAKFVSRAEGDFASPDDGFLKQRKKIGMVENRQTYCLARLETQKQPPKIHGGIIGYYEDNLATADSLEHELLCAFGKYKPKPNQFKEFAANRLPHRNALVQFCKDRGLTPVEYGKGRSAALAVATLTVCRHSDSEEYVAFLGVRSAKAAVSAHMLHVAPSGMFQPSKDWSNNPKDKRYAEEWNIYHHIYRELAEELFDLELEKTPGDTPRRFYSIQDVAELVGMIEAGKRGERGAHLFITAVMVNLLNLRPEVCTLLIIDDPNWYQRHDQAKDGCHPFKRNWEFASDEELREKQRKESKGKIFWLEPVTQNGAPLTDADLQNTLGEQINPINFSIPGAVTFWHGIDLFRHTLSELAPESLE